MTMDIMEKLRSRYKVRCRICQHMDSDMGTVHAVMDEAADEIERLRAELDAERARSLGIARASCPNCREDTVTPAMRCVRCGTGFYAAAE